MTNFEGVHAALGQALTKRGYTDLTPVQTAMLAPELTDADALVSAQTGSGKTVAFGLALATTLLEGEMRFGRADIPMALVIAPTRELALQVKRELDWLYEPTGASIASCVGGMDMRTERRVLNMGAHIVVGTPGRLRDHIERGSLDMSALRAVVLDEADEMLDLGFRDDLEYMLDTAPSSRRTLMFSATVPRSITGLAKRYQRDAVRVSTTSDKSQHLDIDYRALSVAPNDKENAIINMLRFQEAKNAMVFCSTRATVNHMTSRLNNRGFSVVALSGELSQNERTHALQAMRDGRARVCVATDVAARGIDLPDLELVIHADIPKNREILLHRSGRTGRAGRKGVCALIVPYNARKRTERLLSSANIEASWVKPPSLEDITKRDRERFLADPALAQEISADEAPFVTELLARYSPEQIAAALVRQHNSNQPAPEELLDTGPVRPSERKQVRREDFSGGDWVSVSVGRKQNAEPRWLLPMLCRAGHITKREIGSIKIHENETHVELGPDVIEKFLAAVGPSRKMEKTITVDRLRGPKPESSPVQREKRPYRDNDKPRRSARTDAGNKPFARSKPNDYSKPASEKKAFDKPGFGPKHTENRGFEKPNYEKRSAAPKPAGKPDYAAKRANAGGTSAPAVRTEPPPQPAKPQGGFAKKPSEIRTKDTRSKPPKQWADKSGHGSKTKAATKPAGKDAGKPYKPKATKNLAKASASVMGGGNVMMRKKAQKKEG